MAHVTMALYHGPHGLWLSEGKRFPVILWLPDELCTQKQYACSDPEKGFEYFRDTYLIMSVALQNKTLNPLLKLYTKN